MQAKNLNISIEFREISSVIQPGTLMTKQSSVTVFFYRGKTFESCLPSLF